MSKLLYQTIEENNLSLYYQILSLYKLIRKNKNGGING